MGHRNKVPPEIAPAPISCHLCDIARETCSKLLGLWNICLNQCCNQIFLDLDHALAEEFTKS